MWVQVVKKHEDSGGYRLVGQVFELEDGDALRRVRQGLVSRMAGPAPAVVSRNLFVYEDKSAAPPENKEAVAVDDAEAIDDAEAVEDSDEED